MPVDIDDLDVDDDLATYLADLEGRFNALNRARVSLLDRVDDLEDENDSLREELAELREVVNPDPGSTEYDALSKAQKVHRVRRYLVEQAATATTGKSQLLYREVITLVDGNPSPGHAYDLMEAAGNLDGFEYGEDAGGTKRVTANLEAVNDETLIHAANKATTHGGR